MYNLSRSMKRKTNVGIACIPKQKPVRPNKDATVAVLGNINSFKSMILVSTLFFGSVA